MATRSLQCTNPSQPISTLVDLLRHRSYHQADQIAFTFLRDGEEEQDCWSYQMLDKRARAIAVHLQSLNSSGKRALLIYPPGLDFIAAFFGCLYANVIAVPVYQPRRNHHLQRLQAILDAAAATIAFTTEAIKARIAPWLAEVPSMQAISWCATDQLDHEQATLWEEPAVSANTLAFLQYTSGSTGNPKGVMVSHANLLHSSADQDLTWEYTPESAIVTWLPVFHDLGLIFGMLQPIYKGIPCYMMAPVSFLQRPARWLQAISYYRATHSAAPNFAYDLCVQKVSAEQRTTLDLSCWQMAMNGAEPVRPATLAQFSAIFHSCGFNPKANCPAYGLAEATLKVTAIRKRDDPALLTLDAIALGQNRVVKSVTGQPNSQTIASCGQPVLDTQVVIVDPETCTECAANEVGEIWIAGSLVAQGYWNNPEATQNTFQAHLIDRDDESFLRTGDLGFLDNGSLFVTGRLKDLIIIDGMNYYPQDIEQTVESCHPALRAGASAAFAIEVSGQEYLAIAQELERSYVRNRDLDPVISTIRHAIAEQHDLPVQTVLLLKTGSIPKTSSGKIQRQACRQGFLAGRLKIVQNWSRAGCPQRSQKSAVAIQTELVQRLAKQLEVSPNQIDSQQSLAYYGLTSRDAVGFLVELEDWLGQNLSPTIIWDYPTIASLSQYLASDSPTLPLQTATPTTRSTQSEPIAIVGMGCRFPGAANLEQFWQLLQEGQDAITHVPRDRWDPTTLNSENTSGVCWGGFLPDIDQFDPQFFGLSRREASRMDPQQRLLLEVAWETLEQAGERPDELAGSETGVFVGIASQDYSWLQLGNFAAIDAYAGTGNAHSIAANRLSYWLDLRGPSMAVDTACSASLVAVHLAVQSLWSGDCNLAIAGGVNVILNPHLNLAFSQAQMMAADGRCKSFDARADGYVRSEGCGVVLLKRLSDAAREGNQVLALLRGTAITQDGRSNGLTAPNGLAQQSVVQRAIAQAGITPAQISYVEAHGTGTALGDPIEIAALKAVLMDGRSPHQPCWIGSVKANIGHLEAAAGIAGLIKVVLALQHREIPAQPHLQQLNPLIDLQNTPLNIVTQQQHWTTTSERRWAGVSSFGFGGTNAHAILEEAPVEQVSAEEAGQPRSLTKERPLHVLTLSAPQPAALWNLADRYQQFLGASPASLTDICYTANARRSQFRYCLAIVAKTVEQMREYLTQYLNGDHSSGLWIGDGTSSRSSIAFLFTGQGSQYPGMSQQLYTTSPLFRRVFDECDAILYPYLQRSLLDILYSNQPDAVHLDDTQYAQPTLFAVEYALAMLWKSWGVQPDWVMGHGLGEYVAACVAGVFSLEDGLKLVAKRARLMQSLPFIGAMVAVFTDPEKVAEYLKAESLQATAPGCSIAAINGPQHVVISGSTSDLESICHRFRAEGIRTKRLKVSHAFHSPLMQPILSEFEQIAASISYAQPCISLVSNLTGQPVSDAISRPAYWVQHIQQPVQFAAGIQTLSTAGCSIFIEMGPQSTLSGMGRQCLPDDLGIWLPSLRLQQENWSTLLQNLAALSVQGIAIDWAGFDRDYCRQRVALPTYPFQRQHCWIEESTDFSSSDQAETIDLDPVTKANWSQQLAEMNPCDRLPLLVSLLQQEFVRVLGVSSADAVEPTRGFFEMGFDSLMLVGLKKRLERALGHSLSPTLGFNYPTISALAGYLLRDVLQLEADREPEPSLPTAANESADLLNTLEQLSEAEAELLLMEKLNALK